MVSFRRALEKEKQFIYGKPRSEKEKLKIAFATLDKKKEDRKFRRETLAKLDQQDRRNKILKKIEDRRNPFAAQKKVLRSKDTTFRKFLGI